MSTNSFTSLTPLAFLERASDVFANKTAIAYGARRVSYSEFGGRRPNWRAHCASGVQSGERYYTCPNILEMPVANFGVPLAGAVLVPINTRLSAEEVRYICDHRGEMLFADTEYLNALAPVRLAGRPRSRGHR
jgi:fatty-acyl-CoA synthase